MTIKKMLLGIFCSVAIATLFNGCDGGGGSTPQNNDGDTIQSGIKAIPTDDGVKTPNSLKSNN